MKARVTPRDLPQNIKTGVPGCTQRARHFYKRSNAFPMYDHAHRVLEVSKSAKMVEPHVVVDLREDPKRRLANYILAETILYHVIDYDMASAIPIRAHVPKVIDEVMKEIELFTKLTKLERSGAPLSEFQPLLNNGDAPLALLAKIADYAVTHDMEDRLEGLVGPPEFPIFRTYQSREEAYASYLADAKVAEEMYAPVAELFGYPYLAGTILRHSYKVNHPEIHEHVTRLFADDVIQNRLILTRRMAKEIAKQLSRSLKSYGFDAAVVLRPQKNPGKLMRKMHRVLADDFKSKVPPQQSFPDTVEEYVRQHSTSFEPDRVHDWIALRVVVDKYKGKPVDKMSDEERAEVVDSENSIAATIITNVVQTVERIRKAELGLIKPRDYTKPNGYKAYHWDLSTNVYLDDSSQMILPFELQLKTTEWHAIAEHGKAAHYYYLGGDTNFMDMISHEYHEIIHRNTNGNAKKS